PAITNFNVLDRFDGYTLVELILKTGRTHQIRVHMSDYGHPLVGDRVYGRQKQPFNLIGQALHAKVLGFVHPRTNIYMEFETQLPDYFNALIKAVGHGKR
ncbi:MAG: RNA pseudouridine synthase, partial [Clostridiales bacterium]|nr:RNA pseudouridine synthase [Clostridiales bacterium]